MMDDLIAAYLRSPALANEGNVAHMYLDTVGLVTIGDGAMLPNADAAAALPFLHTRTNAPATVAEIRAEFAHIRTMPASHLASFYKAFLYLPQTAIDALTAAKCRGFVGDLQRVFPAFGQFPQPAQLALLDMTFNLGIGRAPTAAARGTGLQAFTHLCAAVRSRDWKTAALTCDRNKAMPAFDGRNAWTRAKFIAAAAA